MTQTRHYAGCTDGPGAGFYGAHGGRRGHCRHLPAAHVAALDDCLYALQVTIAHPSRSALHRCFQYYGISRLPLPDEDGHPPQKKKLKGYPVGCLHGDFVEVHPAEGNRWLLVAIDRTGKVAFAELHPRATRLLAAEFLRRVLEKLPCKVHKLLTDNGVQFTAQQPGGHRFYRVCAGYGTEHRLVKPVHPWTNGQVERMNSTVKEATVQRGDHYQTTDELNQHLQSFLLAYNHAKRLKSLRGLTPHEFVRTQWQMNPVIFTQGLTHLTLGLYI